MSGAATGDVKFLLRAEGACVLLISLLAYSKFGMGWGTFVLFFLVPDLSFFGYLAGPRVGAASYNAAHSYIGALLILATGVLLTFPVATSAGLIWCAHIGFDRMLGYGLKYFSGFGFTHLGLIGPARSGKSCPVG
ncbi:MAG TPA: DUF4260 domain-containing protein [Rhodanobacter sp.]|nr:DUF4260 domain-containing protein [Rhodanobacter sp.]